MVGLEKQFGAGSGLIMQDFEKGILNKSVFIMPFLGPWIGIHDINILQVNILR